MKLDLGAGNERFFHRVNTLVMELMLTFVGYIRM